MITPKEIAEKIAKGIFHLDDENVKSLAHDYLELKNHVDWLCKNTVGKTDHDNILKSTSDLFKEEITKLKEENEALSKDLKMCREIGVEMQREVNRKLSVENDNLNKSREALRRAVEFYSDEQQWNCTPENLTTYNTIGKDDLGIGDFHLTKDVDDDRVGGKKAREAIKADDEIMGGE